MIDIVVLEKINVPFLFRDSIGNTRQGDRLLRLAAIYFEGRPIVPLPRFLPASAASSQRRIRMIGHVSARRCTQNSSGRSKKASCKKMPLDGDHGIYRNPYPTASSTMPKSNSSIRQFSYSCGKSRLILFCLGGDTSLALGSGALAGAARSKVPCLAPSSLRWAAMGSDTMAGMSEPRSVRRVAVLRLVTVVPKCGCQNRIVWEPQNRRIFWSKSAKLQQIQFHEIDCLD